MKGTIDLCLKHSDREIHFTLNTNRTEYENVRLIFFSPPQNCIWVYIQIYSGTRRSNRRGLASAGSWCIQVIQQKAFFGRILHININVFSLKSIAILGDCFLMAAHYRNVGHGSNENVITASAEAVQGESSPADKQPFTLQPPLPARWWIIARPMRTYHLTRSLTHFIQ